MAGSRLEFRILGPLAVRVDGALVPAGGPKQRALLALLLLDANRVVSRDRLVGELFPEQSVNSADHALRNHVSRLRKVLGTSVGDEPRLVARPPGYLLRVEPGELDLETFEQLVVDGHEALGTGDFGSAAAAFRSAESLWHGRPLADLELEPFARLDVERLEEQRLAAVEGRVEAELALGRQAALVPELESLCAEHPLRERFRAQLMLALYRAGRQAESLEVYRTTRRLLDDELGLSPSAELQELERAILVQDPELALGDHSRTIAAPLLPAVCPFKGLAPFEAADAEFFFGRERLVDELVSRLGEAPLLAIVGVSGSGKSSLLHAGLLPSLASRRQIVVRPGEHPLRALTTALGASLTDTLDQVPTSERVVIAVDQFEELFGDSVPDDERRRFIGDLVEAAWDPERRAVVLIALRADFFGRLAAFAELADLVGTNQVLLGPMNAGELRRAIEGPAERAGLSVEPRLVDTLVDDVMGEPGGLPLLSTALLDLWLDRDDSTLTLAAYERLGGIRTAIARHAEGVFGSLDEGGQAIARRVMVRLASDNGTALTRRRVTRAELDADDENIAGVIAALVENRLLVAHDDFVELVHEAMLEHWPRLAGWLEDDAQGRSVRRRLTNAAVEWDAGGRDRLELFRGARLAATLEWADGAAELNRVEREFLAASRLAAQEDEARRHRTNRRLLVALVVVLAALVLAVVAGVIAARQRAVARRQATAADAQRLGAQALVEPTLDRSLLLAREGVNLDDSLATRSNLLAALLRSPSAVGVAREGSKRFLDEALSPDGRVLVARGDDGGIAFFDARTLRPIGRTFPSSDQLGLMGFTPGPFHALAFSPDSRTLAVGSTTGTTATVFSVDVKTRAIHWAKADDSQEDTADIAYSPDGRLVATGEPVNGRFSPPDEVVVVRDARSGKTLAKSAAIPDGRLFGFTDGGRDVLVTTSKKSLLLKATTLKQVRSIDASGAAAISPDGREGAFGHDNGSVQLVDLQTGRSRTFDGRVASAIEVATFSPDGGALATGDDDGLVQLWDVRTGTVRTTLEGHTGTVRGALFSPDGRTLYTASSDGSVIAWDLSGARSLGQPFRFTSIDDVNTWADATQGGLFALSPGPNRVSLWRLPAHELGVLRGPVASVHGLALSRDGTLIAAVGDGKAVLWDVRRGRILHVIPTGPHGAAGVAISPDDRVWAIGTEGPPTVIFVDVRTGKELGRVTAKGSVQDIDFSPDGKLLASADLTGVVHLWNVAHQTDVAALPSAIAAFAVRFSPDGKLVAVGDSSGAVRFWNPLTGKQVGQPLVGGGGSVNSVDFSPDGTILVTGSTDGKLRLWDVGTRKLIGGPLPGAAVANAQTTAAYFSNGKHVLGVFSTGTGVVWNVDPAAWKSAACRVANRELTQAEWQSFLPGRPYRRVCP
jgi:WD40 repeat protein/DNA-binding SARP family transcriptional activator